MTALSLSASISVNDVTVRYNNGHTAIYDVAFALQGGTICALVGVNGSGKSTLFKSIMGLISFSPAYKAQDRRSQTQP